MAIREVSICGRVDVFCASDRLRNFGGRRMGRGLVYIVNKTTRIYFGRLVFMNCPFPVDNKFELDFFTPGYFSRALESSRGFREVDRGRPLW